MKVQIGTEYSAMEIAEYAVSRRYRHDTPISNLQLQKILYFLQVIHASETGELLFADQSSGMSTLSSLTAAASR